VEKLTKEQQQETVGHLAKFLTVQEAIVNELRDQLTAQEAVIAAQNAKLKDKDGRIEDLIKHIHDLGGEIAKHITEHDYDEAMLAKQRDHLIRLRAIADMAMMMVNAVFCVDESETHLHNFFGRRCFYSDNLNWRDAVSTSKHLHRAMATYLVDAVVPSNGNKLVFQNHTIGGKRSG